MNHEQLLTQLIEIKSLSGHETDLGSYITNWFRDRHFEVVKQNDNLVVHIPGKDSQRAFIFNSHMDTVSPGDKPWTYGPWQPTKVDDRMIGLGASDMKAGLASSMLTAELMAKQGVPPVDMWFTYVTKEEEDGSGSAELADWFEWSGLLFEQYKDTAALFTEPTDLTEIQYGHRGNLFLQASVDGQSGHASQPIPLESHAVRRMIAFSDALQTAMRVWNTQYQGSEFNPPSVGELTSIQAGLETSGTGDKTEIKAGSVNKFPSVCRATFDLRTVPGFHEVALSKIQDLAANMGVKIDLVFPPSPSGYTDPSDKLIQMAASLIAHPELTVSQASADLGFFTAKGVKAIILGPGQRLQMHRVDEYCLPAEIPQAVDIYSHLVEAWANHD